MNKTRLAVFDLDGTLLDTVADLGGATDYALHTLGYPGHTLPEYRLLCGRGIYNLFRGALPSEANNEENVSKMAALFLSYYGEHMCDKTRPYPGIHDMLATLSSNGVSLCVASNKYQEGAERLVRHFFGDIPFLRILGQREGQPIKPDPEIVGECESKVPGITSSEVVYVGDSNVDMQTGINAGVRTIGVSWGFRSVEELKAYSPWGIAEGAAELTRMILFPEEFVEEKN